MQGDAMIDVGVVCGVVRGVWRVVRGVHGTLSVTGGGFTG